MSLTSRSLSVRLYGEEIRGNFQKTIQFMRVKRRQNLMKTLKIIAFGSKRGGWIILYLSYYLLCCSTAVSFVMLGHESLSFILPTSYTQSHEYNAALSIQVSSQNIWQNCISSCWLNHIHNLNVFDIHLISLPAI